MKERTWMQRLDGQLSPRALWSIGRVALRAPDSSLFDLPRTMRGFRFSLDTMWPEVSTIDLTKEVPELRMPVFFFLGRNDHWVPPDTSVAYFEALTALRNVSSGSTTPGTRCSRTNPRNSTPSWPNSSAPSSSSSQPRAADIAATRRPPIFHIERRIRPALSTQHSLRIQTRASEGLLTRVRTPLVVLAVALFVAGCEPAWDSTVETTLGPDGEPGLVVAACENQDLRAVIVWRRSDSERDDQDWTAVWKAQVVQQPGNDIIPLGIDSAFATTLPGFENFVFEDSGEYMVTASAANKSRGGTRAFFPADLRFGLVHDERGHWLSVEDYRKRTRYC
jgi:hypothetical protein